MDGSLPEAVEFGKKQYHESWSHSEWGPGRQAKLDTHNEGRRLNIIADHMNVVSKKLN